MITELIILNGLLLIAGVLVLRRPSARRRRSDVTHRCHPAPLPESRSRRPAETELALQLAFVDLVDDAVVLDCVITDEDTTIGPAGWPVTVLVRRPDDWTVVGLMCELLRRWATENVLVRFTFRDRASRSRVSITDGATTLNFDPDPSYGVQLRIVWLTDDAPSS